MKEETAYRTISEVSNLLQVPASVLRFWETQFPQLTPMKRAGGRRLYGADEVMLIATIRDLLYKEGLTIKGAVKRLQASKKESKSVEKQVSIADVSPNQWAPFVAELKDIRTYLADYL